ncbi:MAG: hypothetical protein ACM3O3_09780 [Syntrophothermus sp.]
MSFWRNKIVKTRKDHKCAFCSSVIPKGFNAEYNCGLYEGDFHSFYICEFCNKFIEEYNCDLSEGFDSRELYEQMDELCECGDRLYLVENDIKNSFLEFECDECEYYNRKISYEDFFTRLKNK